MITDFGIVSVKEQDFDPLPLNAGHAKDLITTVAQVLAASGATSEELMTIYSPAPVLWEIPSLYSPDLLTSTLNASVTMLKSKGASALYSSYTETADIVIREGFSEAAEARLEATFGRSILHPLYFTRTKPTVESGAIFGMEWAALLSSVATESIFQDNQAFVRLAVDYFTPRMGLIDGRCEKSASILPELVQELLEQPRGYIEYGTFDALDRANLWVMQNSGILEEPQKLLRALSLLKLTQNSNVAHSFEQVMHKLPMPVVLEPTLKMLIYNDDSLNAIRDIWYDYNTSNKDKFYQLHLQLVPTYLDDNQFKEMFKHTPKSVQRFSYKMEMDVNRGLDRFVTLFLQTRRAIAQGKRIVMKE